MRDLARGLRSYWRDRGGRAILAVAGTVIGTGTVFYRFVEDMRWLDSLYFCVITLTTVGYGDIAPATRPGKVFTMFYVIVGVGVFVALVTTIAHHLLEAKRDEGSGRRARENIKNRRDRWSQRRAPRRSDEPRRS